ARRAALPRRQASPVRRLAPADLPGLPSHRMVSGHRPCDACLEGKSIWSHRSGGVDTRTLPVTREAPVFAALAVGLNLLPRPARRRNDASTGSLGALELLEQGKSNTSIRRQKAMRCACRAHLASPTRFARQRSRRASFLLAMGCRDSHETKEPAGAEATGGAGGGGAGGGSGGEGATCTIIAA